MFNQITLIGRITKDLEIRRGQSGVAVLSFSIVLNEKYLEKEETFFFNCVAFGKVAELIQQYTGKGKMIMVHGKLTNREYDDKSGNKKQVHEIRVDKVIFIDRQQMEKQSEKPIEPQESPRTKELNSGARPIAESKKFESPDDDLPF
jgi:single-strand DNA-binding protein